MRLRSTSVTGARAAAPANGPSANESQPRLREARCSSAWHHMSIRQSCVGRAEAVAISYFAFPLSPQSRHCEGLWPVAISPFTRNSDLGPRTSELGPVLLDLGPASPPSLRGSAATAAISHLPFTRHSVLSPQSCLVQSRSFWALGTGRWVLGARSSSDLGPVFLHIPSQGFRPYNLRQEARSCETMSESKSIRKS
jgi:hypothetical protein